VLPSGCAGPRPRLLGHSRTCPSRTQLCTEKVVVASLPGWKVTVLSGEDSETGTSEAPEAWKVPAPTRTLPGTESISGFPRAEIVRSRGSRSRPPSHHQGNKWKRQKIRARRPESSENQRQASGKQKTLVFAGPARPSEWTNFARQGLGKLQKSAPRARIVAEGRRKVATGER
jgi:hypothetical protein